MSPPITISLTRNLGGCWTACALNGNTGEVFATTALPYKFRLVALKAIMAKVRESGLWECSMGHVLDDDGQCERCVEIREGA